MEGVSTNNKVDTRGGQQQTKLRNVTLLNTFCLWKVKIDTEGKSTNKNVWTLKNHWEANKKWH